MNNNRPLLIVSDEYNVKSNDFTTVQLYATSYKNLEKAIIEDTVLVDNNENIMNIISSYNWIIDSKGYPITRISNKDIRMHQLIMEECFGKEFVPTKKSGKVIDHLNNNPCDNRLRNLHILTKKENENKKLLDKNFDNLTFYIDYNYNFNCMLYSNSSNCYTLNDTKKLYRNRKYILSYISEDMLFKANNNQSKPFNSFELVYADYQSFADDIKHISMKTEKINNFNSMAKSNSSKEELSNIKDIKDIVLNNRDKEELKEVIEEILNKKNWQYIRNINCNIITREEFNNLSEAEKHFYLTIKNTVFQYLPPNFKRTN